jgi:acyl CoA:acetate/3-ketoacid CoA transferase alpha subunit
MYGCWLWYACHFTPAGVGTEVAEGKEIRNFNGKDYLLEYAFDADFAIVKLGKATPQEISFTNLPLEILIQ